METNCHNHRLITEKCRDMHRCPLDPSYVSHPRGRRENKNTKTEQPRSKEREKESERERERGREREGERGRERDRDRERQRDRKTKRHTQRQRDRQRQRQTETDRDRDRQTDRQREGKEEVGDDICRLGRTELSPGSLVIERQEPLMSADLQVCLLTIFGQRSIRNLFSFLFFLAVTRSTNCFPASL